jgi:bifunctional DNase/RNase
MVECELSRLVISENQETPTLVMLREKDGERTLTIGIHIVEAIAINRKLTAEDFPRPMTHDLTCSLIAELGGSLNFIVISDLKINDTNQGTFFAFLNVSKEDGAELDIDCRPSDAIALAVREKCPIYIAEKVLDGCHSQGNSAAE